MKSHEQPVFRFGHFVLVPSERLLLRDGEPLALTGKAFDMLVILVRNAGHLLTKDDLMHAVWPGVVVGEVNLSVNVSALRKVLGVAPTGEGIETVPRQGYRFNAAVEVGDVATAAQPGPLREAPISRDVGGGPRAVGVGPAPAREPTAHAQAYQTYLQGRYLWNQRSEASLQSERGASRAARNGCALKATLRQVVRRGIGACRTRRDGRSVPVARRAFDERSHWLVWLHLDPRWTSLRKDSRFATLVARIKYPA